MIAQFARIGLFSRQLTTQEIIQLFYIRYNPEAIEGQQIGESTSYSTPLIKASVQENFMNAAQAPTIPQPSAPQYAEPVATQQPVVEVPAVETQFAPAPEAPVFPPQPEFIPEPAAPSVAPEFTAPTQPAHLQPVPEIHIANNPDLLNTAPAPVAPAPQPIEPPAAVAQPTPPAAADTTVTYASAAEAAMQADLNAALQSLGTAPITPGAQASTAPATAEKPLDDLPPLPEI